MSQHPHAASTGMPATETPATGTPATNGAAAGGEQPEAFDALMDRLSAEQDQAEQDRAAQEQEAREQADQGVFADGQAGEGEDRPEPPLLGDEAATLDGFLEFLRATVLTKTSGLTDEQGSRQVLGTLTTVTGLLRHLADVERYWFREVLGGVPEDEVGYRWMDTTVPGDPDLEFRLEDGASVEEARADYREACQASREQLGQRELDEEVRGSSEPRTVRWVVVHMLEETGRHVGHLDVLTELVDGRTGE